MVLGGINMDLVTLTPRFPEPGETVVGSRYLTYPGGKGANQAVAAARMGAQVRMIGRVGGDTFGRELLDSLTSNGIDASGVEIDPGSSSGIAVISIDASGENRIVQIPGANGTCGEAEVERVKAALPDAAVLMLQLEVPVEVSLAAAREGAFLNKVVVLDPAPARPVPTEFYPHCSYITPNETEAQSLVGFPVVDGYSAGKAAEELIRRGAACAIIKMGARGAYYSTSKVSRHLLPFQVQPVDTVAAGDAFNGALAAALAEGRDLDTALRWAMAAGALAVTRPGALDSMPHREDVQNLLT